MKGLENDADLAGPVGGRIGESGQRLSPIVKLPRAGLVERAKQLQQGGFAATAGSGDGHEFALLDAEIHAAQRLAPGRRRIPW